MPIFFAFSLLYFFSSSLLLSLSFFLSFVLLFFLCSSLFLLRLRSGLYVILVAKKNTKTPLMQKGSSSKGDEISGPCSMHRKTRSGYKDVIEKLQEKIFLLETYKHEEGKSKAVHEGVRRTEAWLHSFLTSAIEGGGVSFTSKRSYPRHYCVAGWVNPSAELNALEKYLLRDDNRVRISVTILTDLCQNVW